MDTRTWEGRVCSVTIEQQSHKFGLARRREWKNVLIKINSSAQRPLELRIEQIDSVFREIFVFSAAESVEIGDSKFSCSVTFPSYRTRLTINSSTESVVSEISQHLQVASDPEPRKGAATVAWGLGASARPNFLGPAARVASVANTRPLSHSGFTPPLKKATRRLTPQACGKENASNQRSDNVREDQRTCSKNLFEELEQAQNSFTDPTMSTTEQRDIIETVERGDSIFFTGGAGTGKSTLLKHLISLCQASHTAKFVHVCAPTGMAACALQGVTIHQLFGIPAVSEDAQDVMWSKLISSIAERRIVVQRLIQAKVLVIDEVSMLGPRLFEFMNTCLQHVRKNSLPMGGVQLICCGDFFQLPPVHVIGSRATAQGKIQTFFHTQPSQGEVIYAVDCSQPSFQPTQRRYCFQSPQWETVFPLSSCRLLTTIYRQAGDSEFVQLLDALRTGRVRAEQLQELNSQCHRRELATLHGVQPTQILTHKKAVDTINTQSLSELTTPAMQFSAQDQGEPAFLQLLERHCPAKLQLELKVGAQVVLVKSTHPSRGLVNGARGIVLRFQRETRWPIVKFSHGEEVLVMPESFVFSLGGKALAQRTQLPLDLAWAISVHKAQGMTVDQAIIDLSSAFEVGQTYVALSRVRSRDGLSLRHPISLAQVKVDSTVQEFDQRLRQQQLRKQQDGKQVRINSNRMH